MNCKVHSLMIRNMNNVSEKPNSNSSWNSLCLFCINAFRKGMNLLLPPTMDK